MPTSRTPSCSLDVKKTVKQIIFFLIQEGGQNSHDRHVNQTAMFRNLNVKYNGVYWRY